MRRILTEIARDTGIQFPDASIVRRQPLWDTQTYTSGTTTQVTFFGTVRTDKSLGFVLKANSIPAPNYFYLNAIRLFMKPSVNPSEAPSAAAAPLFVKDVWTLLFNSQSYLEFQINNDPKLQIGPVGHFSPGFGMSGFAAVHYTQASAANAQVAVDYAQAGSPMRNDMFLIDPGYLLRPETGIALTLNWSAAQTLSGDAKLLAYLDGYLITPSKGFEQAQG